MKIEGRDEVLYIQNKNGCIMLNSLNQLILTGVNLNEQDARNTGTGTLYVDENGVLKVVL
jgi:hypothetical protein